MTTFIFFTSKLCKPCVELGCHWNSLKDLNPQHHYFQYDFFENQKIAKIFGVTKIPTVIRLDSVTGNKPDELKKLFTIVI